MSTPPAHPDDLHCNTCPEIYPFRGSHTATWDLARTNGWHIMPDGARLRLLCPNCIGTSRTRLPKVTNFEGQADIFDDLGIDLKKLEQADRWD